MDNEFDADRLPLGLLEVIEFYFPDTSLSHEPYLGFSKPSERIAQQFDDAYRFPLLAFGLGPNEDAWNRVRRAANELQRAIIALKPDGLRQLDWLAPRWWESDKHLSFEAYRMALHAKDAAAQMMIKRRVGLEVSKKRDWRSAALAKCARSVWAAQAWRFDSDRPATHFNYLAMVDMSESERRIAAETRREYQVFLENFAPKSEKHDGPGPFGRFLESVLRVFGCTVSAASALRSMVQAQNAIDNVSRKTR